MHEFEVNLKSYVHEIYQTDDALQRQLRADVPRSNVCIYETRITNAENLYFIVKHQYPHSYHKRLLFATQASLAPAVCSLQRLFREHERYVGETGSKLNISFDNECIIISKKLSCRNMSKILYYFIIVLNVNFAKKRITISMKQSDSSIL